MRFWDSSAILPLLVAESTSERLLGLLEADPCLLVWWATPVECASAVARREREGAMTSRDASAALARLRELSAQWNEVLPADPVRNLAQRLLRTHDLRTADALQLAAAITGAEHDPASLELVCLDARLSLAAEREGLRVLA